MKLDVDDGFKPSSNTQLKLNKNKNFPSSAGELMTVLGLGMTYEGGPDAQVLKHVEVPYIEPETCANVWGDAVVDEQGVLLCAGGTVHKLAVCYCRFQFSHCWYRLLLRQYN